ncbi:MAG: hypothetical protein ACFCU8_11905 [Thermosynechococcaceae cyanobacterium]
MNTKIQLLKADLKFDVTQIQKIYGRLKTTNSSPLDPEQAIVVGYYLHNLYTAFEHLCTLIAAAFENQIKDHSQWHALLLRRMTQNVEGIRPRFLSDQSHQCLDELRRFRHVFRSAYSITLEPDRLELVLKQALQLESLYQTDLEVFERFLASLSS